MAKSRNRARIRTLADRYDQAVPGTVYSGRDGDGRHYFSDGVIHGDAEALGHMIALCQAAGIEWED